MQNYTFAKLLCSLQNAGAQIMEKAYYLNVILIIFILKARIYLNFVLINYCGTSCSYATMNFLLSFVLELDSWIS